MPMRPISLSQLLALLLPLLPSPPLLSSDGAVVSENGDVAASAAPRPVRRSSRPISSSLTPLSAAARRAIFRGLLSPPSYTSHGSDGDEGHADVREDYLTQRWDHFAPPIPGETAAHSDGEYDDDESGMAGGCQEFFKQRYFYSDRFVIVRNEDDEAAAAARREERGNERLRSDGGGGDNDNRGRVGSDNRGLRRDGNVVINGGRVGPADSDANATATYAFLCVGGEGPALTKSVLVDSEHCTGDMLALAERLHDKGRGASVHLFALEHRYYGKSFPPHTPAQCDGTSSGGGGEGGTGEPPQSVASLSANCRWNYFRHLSSRQALADLSHFVSTVGRDITSATAATFDDDSTDEVKWVAFGGSYPGMLSSWARLRFPHLIHASVSNSAPVQPRVDFSQYQETVGDDLRYELVGGSDECHELVRRGHEDLATMLSSLPPSVRTSGGRSSEGRDRERVASLFKVCGGGEALLDRRNVDLFIGDGVLYVPAQSNDPSCEGELCNIDKLCTALLEDAPSLTTVERLAHVSNRQLVSNCTNVQWDDYVRSITSAPKSGELSWLWQTCTEFGFYQTCEVDSECPFARGFHTIEQDIELCRTLFGIGKKKVRRNVKETLEWYGGWNIESSSSRILFVNGDVDPWKNLAVTDAHPHPGGGPNVFMVEGSSHHFWTHNVKDSDDTAVATARENIYDRVTAWLLEGGSRTYADAAVDGRSAETLSPR